MSASSRDVRTVIGRLVTLFDNDPETIGIAASALIHLPDKDFQAVMAAWDDLIDLKVAREAEMIFVRQALLKDQLSASNKITRDEGIVAKQLDTTEINISRYYATDKKFGSMFTPVAPHALVTHAHGLHKSWKIGDQVPVLISGGSPNPQEVQCEVHAIHGRLDIIIVTTTAALEAPTLADQDSLRPGTRYLLLGSSNRSQVKQPFSISHGVISTILYDKYGHIRGDSPSVKGDSGGGCYHAETGELIAINVASDTTNNRAVLVPIPSLVGLLPRDDDADPDEPDWGPGE